MMDIIEYEGVAYPALQSTGFAAQYAFPFAKSILRGEGYDVGSNRQEWCFPGARMIDQNLADGYNALHLPEGRVDYIFSSHMLEHIEGRFQDVIEYWLTVLRPGGVIFLYLPNCEYQKYWAWGNTKHIHYLCPSIMREYCSTLKINKFFVTDGYDLNGSFYCVIEK